MKMTFFLRFARALLRGLYRILAPIDAVNKTNVPSSGAAILCANHESLTDPIAMICALDRWVRFMAKKELFSFKPLGALLGVLGVFPVDRGHASLSSMRTAFAILKEGEILGIFPQGKRAFKGGGPFYTGTAMIALRSGAPVIPVYIDGRQRLFRKTRHIYGAPVDLSAFAGRYDSEGLAAATQAIEAAIYALKPAQMQ